MAGGKKLQEREKLKNIIAQWNANRLDIFWLTEPNEDLEFHGAMRFYFQDAGQKVATKCIRVSSTAFTSDVVKTLIEKFRPDIRMLSIPEYALYEIHENGEERKLGDNERPLFVQLDWHKDDREGRFLLRRMDEKSYISSMDAYDNDNFKRKLSKREKKEKKKREKKERLKASEESKKDGIAEKLYSELPETSFTRSISNPEAVMRRRRQQILEKKLQQFCQEGGTDAGGTLRIFGESLNKDVPYKTLLLSMKDTAAHVVKEILDKYGYDKEDPAQYCLLQVIIPHQSPNDNEISDFSNNNGIREYILDDDDCPLVIEHQYNRTRGTLTFHVRRRPADYQPRKRKKKPKATKGELDSISYGHEDSMERMPFLLELNPDGSEIPGPPKKHRLYLNVTEVGSERTSSTRQYLQLFGPNVQPRHCVIAHTEGIVTVTPSSRDAETYVNNMRIYETTILQPGMVVRFGKLHAFKFIDPMQAQKHRMLPDPRQSTDFIERSARHDDQLSLHQHGSYETTFDADGNVETVSTHSRDDRMSKKSEDAHSHRSLGRESSQARGSFDKYDSKRGNDPILPAVLEFWEEGEDSFLSAVISQADPNHVQFKLSPTYVLYMAARFRASTHFRPKNSPSDRAKRLTALMNKIASHVHQVIQNPYRDASSLTFWLANASELLHFLKQDRHLSAYTLDAQDLLAESVQLAFRSLVTCQQTELQSAMPVFFEDRDDIVEEEGTTAEVLAVLSSAMSLQKRCRVNAALTIQMFSQLFHYINMWLFNKVVCESKLNFCTRLWGVRLKRRLSRVEAWAENQGLELATDCHLSRIVQAAHLLQAPKSNSEDLTSISTLCYKLNSLQLKCLLEKYQTVPEEPRIPRELIDSVVKVAENTADEQARAEGRDIRLEEDTDLQLPFLLPEDGYSCDVVRDVPAGLKEFLDPLMQTGLCRLTIQPSSSGYWTIYMSDQDIARMPRTHSPSIHSNAGESEHLAGWGQNNAEPEVATISLQKSNNGIGLSIVAAGGVDQDKLGIYVKSVVKGGAADLDGRLQAGDQLLKVDGQSLVGVNQEKAAELMTRTGPVVTLEVAKQGAIFNGIADLLNKPSPIIPRGPRHMSERDIPTRVMDEHGNEGRLQSSAGQPLQPRMQSSKSVPSLNSGNHQETPVIPAIQTIRSQEIVNPAYSRTSSTTSIPKSADFSDNSYRSRSASNLRQDQSAELKYPYPPTSGEQVPPPYPGPPTGGITLRPSSQPNLHQPPVLPQHHPILPPPQSPIQEERHYQNISLYQQPQQSHLPPNMYPHARSPSHPIPSSQIARQVHGSQSSLNRTEVPGGHSQGDRSRPMSTLVSPREQEQYVNSLGCGHSPVSGPQPSPKNMVQPSAVMDPRHMHPYGPRIASDHREFHSAENIQPSDPNDSQKFHSHTSNPEQFGRVHATPQQQQEYNAMMMEARHRDVVRQEAKMEEMREEVRRREERERMMLQQQQPHYHHQMVRAPQHWPHPPRHPNMNVRTPANYHHMNSQHPNIQQPYSGGPPPPAPKPRPVFNVPNERFQRPPRYEHIAMNGSPMYQENPNTVAMHPSVVAHQNNARFSHPPPPVVSYRYGPSGYPPRGVGEVSEQRVVRHGFHDVRMVSPQIRAGPPSHGPNSRVTFEMPPAPVSNEGKDSKLTSPSPWEREEKEKLNKQKMENAKHALAAEIRELETIPYMSQKQEERLRTLRLEQEFQRRAEELRAEEEDDDDDDELLDRAENRERMLKMQEDLERARQRRLVWEQEHIHRQQMLPQQLQHAQKQPNANAPHSQLEEQEGRLRQLRTEEVNRKQELEATRNAEQRLLMEARRRQDEFIAPQSAHPAIPNRPAHLLLGQPNIPNSKALSGVVDHNVQKESSAEHPINKEVPPPLPTSPPPQENELLVNNNNQVSSYRANSQTFDLRTQQVNNFPMQQQNNSELANEKHNEPPAPPQRKSSYEITNQISSPNSIRHGPSVMKNGDNTAHQSKKVSFNDACMKQNTSDCDANGNTNQSSSQSYTLDDIDEVLATPQNSQNLNLYNPGKTPGVIGAQEIYRDPRQRIEAQRSQHENYPFRNTGPEKLTFKEKMKMFAQETGEPETPKDKVKISRAQRDIETNLNGNGN